MLNPWTAKYAAIIEKYSKQYHFDSVLVAAVIQKESKFVNGTCFHGSHGLMQIQMSPRSCGRTLAIALIDGLYNPEINIQRGVQTMHLWRGWVSRNHMKHHWLLNYNQGYGSCPGKKRNCRKKERVPVDTGYADRVLSIYRKLKIVQEKRNGKES